MTKSIQILYLKSNHLYIYIILFSYKYSYISFDMSIKGTWPVVIRASPHHISCMCIARINYIYL